jgi:hypothetical protein
MIELVEDESRREYFGITPHGNTVLYHYGCIADMLDLEREGCLLSL